MKALILIAAGLMSSGAIAQSTMNNMSGQTTGSVTHTTKQTTVRHTGTVTHNTTMTHRRHHVVRHHRRHTMKPIRHTTMHKKVTVETKTKM